MEHWAVMRRKELERKTGFKPFFSIEPNTMDDEYWDQMQDFTCSLSKRLDHFLYGNHLYDIGEDK